MTPCKNWGDFTETYMMNDVLLLADMFESFREICMKIYGIDPCWCYGAPGLAWQPILEMNYEADKRMCLETLKTKEMHQFFENPRGGITDARTLCMQRPTTNIVQITIQLNRQRLYLMLTQQIYTDIQ